MRILRENTTRLMNLCIYPQRSNRWNFLNFHTLLLAVKEDGCVSCELPEKCKKVDELNANKTQKLIWWIPNNQKDAKHKEKTRKEVIPSQL